MVGEDDVAEAIVFLLERAKLVVEGAGAVGVAALLSGRLARMRDARMRDPVGRERDAGLLGETSAVTRARWQAARDARVRLGPTGIAGAAADARG